MKKIMFIIGIVSGVILSTFGNEPLKYNIQNKEIKLFVGFKTNENGSAVYFENGTNFITQINKQQDISKASSYSKDEIHKMLKEIVSHPQFVKYIDSVFDFCFVDDLGNVKFLKWSELK